MTKQKTYSEKLKDPRWQKKRLKILERDEFTCQSCEETGATLAVHHLVPYRKNTEPWEYEDDELITFCEDCHKNIEKIIKDCLGVIMGRCWSLGSADELWGIMEQIDGLNPYDLSVIKESIPNLLKEAHKKLREKYRV